LKKIIYLLILILICACASKTVKPIKLWPYEEKAIILELKASNKLNLYEEIPHTLVICVYQLKDPNAFNQYIEDEEGIIHLLECNRFDESVMGFKKLVIQPGEEQKAILDRAENARYVGIVAGYYNLEKKQVIRLYNIPLIEEKKGFIRRKKIIKPGILNVKLALGPYGLEKEKQKKEGKK